MESLIKSYKKYRWFCTSKGNLVIGGKNAEQNEELLKNILSLKKNFIITHTSEPGSPFCVILADSKSIDSSEIKQCAIFTGCFSRAWRFGKKQATIDIFSSGQIYKTESMKVGTWGVKPIIKRIKVDLILSLTIQKEILRAVPIISVNKKEVLFYICPGKIDKQTLAVKLAAESNLNFRAEDFISAMPSGGSRVLQLK